MEITTDSMLSNKFVGFTSNHSKLYNLISLSGFIYFFCVSIIKIIYTNIDSLALILLSISLTYLFSYIFFSVIKTKSHIQFWIFYFISFAAFNTCFVLYNGFINPVIYLLFPLILVTIYLTNLKTTSIIISLIGINLIVLFFINHHWPNLSYITENKLLTNERIASHIIALVLTMIVSNKIFVKYEEDKKNAQESEKAKEAFLANMSHLIRTPLNGINGYAELLCDEEVPDFEKVAFKKRIYSGAQELHHMIFNLIDLSIIQEKSLQFRNSYFKISEIIESLQLTSKEKINISGKNLQVQFIMDKEISNLTLNIDGDRFSQIIWNFIENSIFYSTKGIIKIQINVDLMLECLYIEISDTGKGIDQQMLYQLNNQNILNTNQSTTPNPKPGMGILISKGIIEYFGGKLEITSEINNGTHVAIEIPINNRYEITDK